MVAGVTMAIDTEIIDKIFKKKCMQRMAMMATIFHSLLPKRI